MTTYKVVIKSEKNPDDEVPIPVVHVIRLIEAKTKAQAIAHVVADTIQASICETADAVELGAAGVKVEKAGE